MTPPPEADGHILGNFHTYYSFNPANERLRFMDRQTRAALQTALLSIGDNETESTATVMDVGCNEGDLTIGLYHSLLGSQPEHSVDVVNFDQQHVSALNEWAQSAKRVVTYEFTEGGTQHRKHFACDLKVDGDLYGHGEGVSKKVAKAKAAGEALRKAKGSDESALVTTTLTAEEAPMVSLEKRKQLHVLGVDIDDVLIERAAKKPVTLNQPTDAVRFLQADVACASFNDAINSFSAGVKRDSKANTFDLITCFSVTMWIHLNKGDEGLWLFLDRVAAMTDLLIIEPQPWKCYRNACKRLERMRVEVPRSFSELKVREDVIDRITAFLLESGRFRHKALLGKTNWSRPMLLFSKRPIAGLTPSP